MRHRAPITIQRSRTTWAAMEVSAPIVTSSPMMAKGPIVTPSASFAVGCTMARGSTWSVTACAPLEYCLLRRLVTQLQPLEPCLQMPDRVHARLAHADGSPLGA